MTVEIALAAQAELGEGPLWDHRRRRLLFVDIMRGLVHDVDVAAARDRVIDVGMPVGAVALASGTRLVLAAGLGFRWLDLETGLTTPIAALDREPPTNRMNDGNCDARGRFWAGTLSMTHARDAAALYRLDPDLRVTRQFDGVTNSNGIDWSPDDRRMYYIDTGTGRVDVFDFDLETGAFRNRRPLAEIPSAQGKPDGLTVDADGCVWVALWGGGAVHRYDPAGRLDRRIELPAKQTTKPAFGGADLSELYVTSAWIGLDAAARAAQPHAGDVFVCRPGVSGRPARVFGG